MIVTTNLNPKEQLHHLIEQLSDEKALSLYHFAAYLAELDTRRIMEEEAEIIAAEDAAQTGERNDTAYLMASDAMRERLSTSSDTGQLIPLKVARAQLGI